MGTVTFSTAFSSASAPLQRGAVQEWRAGGSAWIAVATFLVAHAIVPHLAPAHAPLLSLIFLVLAPVLAAVACLRRGHGGGDQGWWMLALALTLWAGGMAANVLVLALGNSSGESNLSMLLFVLYGVPLIFIMASPQNEAWPVRLVDASLALVLGMLFFAYISTLTTMSGTNQSGQASLRTMFDLENLLIAGFALVRFNASRVALERNVLGALTLFALLYAACAGYINHFQADTDYGGPVDLIIDIPFLFMIVLAMRDPGQGQDAPDAGPQRLVQAVSPLMLPTCMLALASALLRLHPVWAVMGFAAATMIYGLRNVLTHLRNLDERDRLERLSQVDELTDLPNRRCFDQTLRREWMRGLRPGNGIAILMIDIDHFKQLNDALGHPEGDIMLRQVANALAGCARRATDLVARYGGEEFVAILSCTDASQANQFAEIMRSSVYELNLPSPVPTGRITISIGVGYLDRIDAYGAERLLAAADEALYEAKRGGRNTVRVHALKTETT